MVTLYISLFAVNYFYNLFFFNFPDIGDPMEPAKIKNDPYEKLRLQEENDKVARILRP